MTTRMTWMLASMASLVSWSCGARTDLNPEASEGTSGEGGAGAGISVSSSGAQGPTSSTGASGGGGSGCETFALDGLPFAVPDHARSPQLTTEGGALRVTWHVGRFVHSQRLEPETRWPEPFEGIEQHVHIGDFGSYLVAASSPSPVFLHTENGAALDLSGAGGAVDPVPAASPGEAPLFLVRNGDRYLYASSNGPTAGVGSYRMGELPLGANPELCLATAPRAAAVASEDGFTAVFADASMPGTSCLAPSPPDGTSVVLMRYRTSSAEPTGTVETVLPQNEPIRHVALAATPTAGWLMFQTDGSTSRVAPPIMAARVDTDGALASSLAPVTPDGVIPSELAATNLDEALAFARVETVDGVQVIRAQRVEADGRPSASVTIDAGIMIATGNLHLMGTFDQRSLILVWGSEEGSSMMAKLDCVP